MDVKFPYENAGKSYFGLVRRPVAKVSFKSPKNNTWADTWMVVDTGADFSVLPRYLSEDLMISLERDCIKDFTSGVGGEQAIYLYKYKIRVKLDYLSRIVPIAFIDSNEIPPLLGRLGFLETFDTEFLKNHTLIFRD